MMLREKAKSRAQKTALENVIKRLYKKSQTTKAMLNLISRKLTSTYNETDKFLSKASSTQKHNEIQKNSSYKLISLKSNDFYKKMKNIRKFSDGKKYDKMEQPQPEKQKSSKFKYGDTKHLEKNQSFQKRLQSTNRNSNSNRNKYTPNNSNNKIFNNYSTSNQDSKNLDFKRKNLTDSKSFEVTGSDHSNTSKFQNK